MIKKILNMNTGLLAITSHKDMMINIIQMFFTVESYLAMPFIGPEVLMYFMNKMGKSVFFNINCWWSMRIKIGI